MATTTSVASLQHRNSISIPYVMSARPNPFRILWSGDWALSFHAWSTLVDIDDGGNAIARLAASWTLSPDGLVWHFNLRPNLKWSDGSPMLDSEIEASLKVSLEGTSHTNLSESINSIEIKNHVVTFKLKRPLPAFLANLAYADWAIVHPKTIRHSKTDIEITALEPCSGPYCVSNSEKTGTVSVQNLTINPHSIFPNKLGLKLGQIIHHDSCLTLVKQAASLLAFRSYGKGLSEACKEELKKQGFRLTPSHPTWILKADFTSRGLKTLSQDERVWLIAKANENLKAQVPDFGVIRATGLRAPHLFGSLSVAEYEQALSKLVPPTKLAKNELKGRTVKLVTMEQWSTWHSFTWLQHLLTNLGMRVEIKILNKGEFAKEMRTGNLNLEFDILFIPLGTSDPDPDNTWRIASRNLYAETLDGESIKAAFLESNREKREEIYKRLSRKILEQGRLIPIMMDADIIGVHESVRFEGVPQYRCGMTLYELVPTVR
jgi:MarR-like DNA-binding transcriptional regulator SgrR of sgrS sRNA